MTATTPEGSAEIVPDQPVKPARRWDLRTVAIVVVTVPLMLALPLLWPRVLDPTVAPPRLDRREAVGATLDAAAALRGSYAETARQLRNYRSGSTAMAIATEIGAAASWALAASPPAVAGAAALGAIVYGGQLFLYNGRTEAAYGRGERVLGCIDEAATSLRAVAPARFADDAKRLEVLLSQTAPRVAPVLADATAARAALAAALRDGDGRDADVGAIDRYEATRTADPTAIARALRDDMRVLDDARRRLATLKPAVAARWRKDMNQLAGLTSRVGQLRQRAEELAKAEVGAMAARALYRAERTAAQDALDASGRGLDATAPLVAGTPAVVAALARQREGLEALARELAGAVESVHEAVVEEIAKPAPSREALRNAIGRLEAVSGVRPGEFVPPPVAAPVIAGAVIAMAPAASPLSASSPTSGAVEPLDPEAAAGLIAAATERANRALAAHGATLGGAAGASATLERAAGGLIRATATIAPARERLAGLMARLGPDGAALGQATAAATTLVRSVDVGGIRGGVVSCLTAAAAQGS